MPLPNEFDAKKLLSVKAFERFLLHMCQGFERGDSALGPIEYIRNRREISKNYAVRMEWRV